jgi:hypothetical protein
MKREDQSAAKNKAEDRVLFLVLPSILLAGVSIVLQQHFGMALRGILAIVCVMLASSPYLAFVAIFFLYFREEKDEFQARMLSGAMLGAVGGTLMVTSVCGAMETLHLIPMLHIGWVMPMFGFFYSVALAVQRWRYR